MKQAPNAIKLTLWHNKLGRLILDLTLVELLKLLPDQSDM
jgi:hypothetical protein